MARFKNNHLGIVTGRIGDTIFKTRKGTPYIASPALIFHKSMSLNSIRARKIFSFSNKVFAALGQIYIIKKIWDAEEISKGTFMNKMSMVNKKKIGEDFDLSNTAFLPYENLFSINSLEAAFDGKQLTVLIEKEIETRSITGGSKCSMQGILFCSSLNEKKELEYKLLPLISEEAKYSRTEDLSFILKLSDLDAVEAEKYSIHKFYINMLIKTENGEPVNGSKVIKVLD